MQNREELKIKYWHLKIWKDDRLVRDKRIDDADAQMGCNVRLGTDKHVTIKAGESKSIDNYKLEVSEESPDDKTVVTEDSGGYRLPFSIPAVVILILAVIALFAFIGLVRSRAREKSIQQEFETQKKVWQEKLLAGNQDYESQKEIWEERYLAAQQKADSGLLEFGDGDVKKFTLSGDELFGPGSAEVKPAAMEKIKSIAEQIKQDYMGCVVLVTGYTDTNPLRRPQTIQTFKDNWNLGAQRALAVVRILQAEGIPGSRLSAISRGEFHPLQTEAQSRRVEIILRLSSTAVTPQQPADANETIAQ